MATDYKQKFSEGRHEDMVIKVAMALEIKAYAELAAGGSSTWDVEKKRLVATILKDPQALARSLALAIAANADVNHDAPDGTFQAIVDASFAKLQWIMFGG